MLSGAAKSARNEAAQIRKQGGDGAEAKASALAGKAANYEKGAAALGGLGSYFQTNAAAGGINAANGHTGGIAGPAGQIAEAGFNFGKNAVENIASALTPFAKNAPEVAAAFEKYGVGPAASNEKSTNAQTGEKTQSARNGVATKTGGGDGSKANP